MNFSTAIFLVRKDIRAVSVSYEVDKDGKGIGPFTVFKTADPSLAVGQHVVIPTATRHNMTVGRVEHVDVEIDFDSGVQVQWLVGAVNLEGYEALLARENEIIDAIKSAEKRRKQEELAAKLLADNPDIKSFGNLDVLPALSGPAV